MILGKIYLKEALDTEMFPSFYFPFIHSPGTQWAAICFRHREDFPMDQEQVSIREMTEPHPRFILPAGPLLPFRS